MELPEIIEQIGKKPSGEIIKSIHINERDYKLKLAWKKYLKISVEAKTSIFKETDSSEIKKSHFLSIIVRAPQYSLRGEKSELTEKLLLNQYTRALLFFRSSKITCQNQQISYTAELKKKNSHQIKVILDYFKELIVTLK